MNFYITEFTISKFLSFKDGLSISLIDNESNVNKVTAILGSNVIKALMTIRDFLLYRDTSLFDDNTDINLGFIIDDDRYDYQCSIVDHSILESLLKNDIEVPAIEFFSNNQECLSSLSVADKNIATNLQECAHYFKHHKDDHDTVIKVMLNLDFGLSNIEIKEDNGHLYPFGIRSIEGHDYTMPFNDESKGTQLAYSLLRRIIPALKQGRIAIVERFDEGLHPLLVDALVDLCKNSKTGQILFTSNKLDMMGRSYESEPKLDNIYFVESEGDSSVCYSINQISGVSYDYYDEFRRL